MIRNAERKASATSIIHWRSDLPILVKGNDLDDLPRKSHAIFSDDFWDLCAAAGKATISKRTISFAACEGYFKDCLKRLVWCMLNVETPIQLIQRPNAARSRLTIGSAVSNYESELRPFVSWLAQNGFTRISDLNTQDIRRYGEEIAQSSLSRQTKARRLWGPTRFWLYAPYLPHEDQLVQPPWEVEGAQELLGPANWSAENKTTPIHPQTMSPLLDWALRFVSEFSEDILSAIKEKQALLAGYRELVQPGDVEKLHEYLAQFLHCNPGIPGFVNKNHKLTIASSYIAVKAKIGRNLFNSQSVNLKGFPINLGCPLDTEISGKVRGAPWIPYFDYYEIESYRQLLVASCVVVISYLSGMRSEECRALQRGCCRTITLADGSSQYAISGLTFKDALDENGNTIHGGVVRAHPWYVIKPVHQAISIMEKLHSEDLLFSESALNIILKKDRKLALMAGKIADRIERFIDWCNSACDRLEIHELKIPPDPHGRVTLQRLRRTLAWFIYRLPGGRISLGIQYGHLRGMTTDGYGSRVSTGLRDVFPMEEAYAMADSLQEAASRLADGEGVSGPSADSYIMGVLEFSETYNGRYLTPRQAAQLRRNPAMRIFDNGVQPVACCYDATKALCHPDRLNKKNVGSTPNLTRCDPRCANVSRTDKHIKEINNDIRWQKDQLESELTPEPLKERHLQRIRNLQDIIKNHETTRKVLTG